MATDVFGPGGAVQVIDPDGDVLDINPDGSINVSGVTLSGEVEVSNDIGNPVPVSMTGVATETTLAELGADIDTIETQSLNLDVPLSTRASEVSLLPVTNRFSPSIGTVSPDLPYSTIGDKTLYTPAAGKRVRLKWVGASSYVTQAPVPIKFKFGSNPYFWDWLLFGAFAHSDVREGAVNEPLYMYVGANGSPVFAAIDVEEF